MPDDLYAAMMPDEIPDGPLFPDGAGEILHRILTPEPQPGPPYVHTFQPPEPEYDENGDPYWPPTPAMTITSTDTERLVYGEYNLTMFGRCPCGSIREGRVKRGVFGEPVTAIRCPACGKSIDG